MQVFNVDESGVTTTQHKGKVTTAVKRKGVHRVVAAEKGKNHTITACGSASGYSLPPMIIPPFPRVRDLKPSKLMLLLAAFLWPKKEVGLTLTST